MNPISNPAAHGVETNPTAAPGAEAGPRETVVRTLSPLAQHLRLTQVILADATDHHNELVQERRWLLHPSEKLTLSGNLFVIEDIAGQAGTILVKQAPLPHARPTPSACDLTVVPRADRGFDIALLESADAPADTLTVPDYQGGPFARTRALHRWQAGLRPTTPSTQPPRTVSHT